MLDRKIGLCRWNFTGLGISDPHIIHRKIANALEEDRYISYFQKLISQECRNTETLWVVNGENKWNRRSTGSSLEILIICAFNMVEYIQNGVFVFVISRSPIPVDEKKGKIECFSEKSRIQQTIIWSFLNVLLTARSWINDYLIRKNWRQFNRSISKQAVYNGKTL